MNSLKRKKIWKNKKTDGSGNTLVVTQELTQDLAPGGSSYLAVSFEIESSTTDELGRSKKIRRRVGVDPAFLDDFTNAVRALRDANDQPYDRNEATVQVRYEMTSGLIVMLEIPAYDSLENRRTKFVIAEGDSIRFVIGATHPELAQFMLDLRNAVEQ